MPLRPALLRYAMRLTENADDAEDVVQEVMLRLWHRRHGLGSYGSIESFAMTMVKNACIDMLRRRKDEEDVEGLRMDSGVYAPDRLLEINDEVRLIREIIDMLPPLQRTIMRMKDVEEYETEEIARITGCSSEAVRGNLSRARKKVRDIYMQAVKEKKRRNAI